MIFNSVRDRAVISLGGGFFRVWSFGKGLTVELPACLVIDRASGAIEAIGEQAAELEGKLPPRFEFVRPFWSDRIIDRQGVRMLLQETLRRHREAQQAGVSGWLQGYELRIPESTLPLHQKWLSTTCREISPLPWKITGSYSTLQTAQKAKSPVSLYVDIGFSSLHLAFLVGESVVASASDETLSLAAFCRFLSVKMLEEEKVRVAPASLYSQEWFVQHAAFHEIEQKPVVTAIPRKMFQQGVERWAKSIVLLIEHVSGQAPPEVRSQLSRSGVSLLGGGAEIRELQEGLEKKLSIPVQVVRQPKYATLREKGA